jgi:hypothetical protein
MDPEPLQVIIRIREGGDFGFAPVAGASIQLANVQGSLQKGMNFSARLFRNRKRRREFPAAVGIPKTDTLFLRQTGPEEFFGSHYRAGADFNASATANAAAIGEPQAGTAPIYLRTQRCRRTDACDLPDDGGRETVRDDIRHPASRTITKQLFDRDYSLWLSKTPRNHVADHRSHPE